MGWTLFLFGVLSLLAGLIGMLALPAMMQGYSAPLVILGGVWIGAGGIIESVDRLRIQLRDRP